MSAGRHGNVGKCKQSRVQSVSLPVITMGFFNNFLTWLKFKKKEANILIVGLDNSGKSTVVQYFQSAGQRTEIVPTIGFRVEKIKSKSFYS